MRVGVMAALLVIAASARGDVSTPASSASDQAARNARLCSECERQLAAHDADFRRCWDLYPHPYYTSGHRKPFFDMTVARDGHVAALVHFFTDTAKARTCLAETLNQFRFTPFSGAESVRLGILDYPSRCNITDKMPPAKQAPPPP
jgi:hypothetical protein